MLRRLVGERQVMDGLEGNERDSRESMKNL
jgi:hypothetical protein